MVKDKLKGKFKFKCNPNPKQKMFFKAKRKYIAYGGQEQGVRAGP